MAFAIQLSILACEADAYVDPFPKSIANLTTDEKIVTFVCTRFFIKQKLPNVIASYLAM